MLYNAVFLSLITFCHKPDYLYGSHRSLLLLVKVVKCLLHALHYTASADRLFCLFVWIDRIGEGRLGDVGWNSLNLKIR